MSAVRSFAPAWTFALLVMAPLAVHADTWAAPQTKTYDSTNGTYRFTTIPPGDKGNAETDRDKARCVGRLQEKQKDGSYTTLWEKSLSNRISPVSALVSDGGTFVVTFDNWHSMGHGNNTVVIYGSQGKVVRELGLRDFLTEDEVRRLPTSVSSIWWGRGHVLDEKNGCVVLKVTWEDPAGTNQGVAKGKDVRLKLETGKVVEGDPKEEKKEKEPAPGTAK